jgi:DNA excision repair protein ERCC-2
MEETVSVWDEIGILRQVVQHKLLFVETPDSVESSLALSNYR